MVTFTSCYIPYWNLPVRCFYTGIFSCGHFLYDISKHIFDISNALNDNNENLIKMHGSRCAMQLCNCKWKSELLISLHLH